MILEADEETRDFVTIYSKDYYRKRSKKLQKCIHPANYNPPLNALNGPYHEYLNSLRKNEALQAEERTEDIRDNLKRIRSKYRHLEKYLPEISPDETVIEAEQKKSFKTIYQLEYLKDLDDYLSLRAQRTGSNGRAVTLSADWIIPETINKRSYRDPRGITTYEELARGRKIIKPKNNLEPNEKEREILRVTTGRSEYDDVISATGDRIFREQLHGPPIPLDPPTSRLKGPDSIRSECSFVLMTRNTPFISSVF